MGSSPPVLDGWIVKGEATTAVQIRFASRYSIWAELGHEGIGPEVENVRLLVGEKVMEVGPCRVLPDESAPSPLRRLVPLRTLHNFEKLFFNGRIETLESSTLNLPLVLSYKEKIDPAFRTYVSDLAYDLNVYKHLLEQLDSESEGEPPEVRSVVQTAIIDAVGRDFMRYLDRRLDELCRIVAKYGEADHEHHGFFFRRQMWNFILCAPLVARTNLKPRGYSGDSEMMRMIYLNDYQGATTFGKLLHKHAIEQPAGVAVRNRRTDVAEIISRFAERSRVRSPDRIRVLSVACGPAFEVRDILRTPADCERLHFSLLDQDPHALLEAAGLIGEIETGLGTSVSVDFIKESVRTMLVTRQPQDRWGRFHFVYSMGLFDYLTPPVAAAVLKKLDRLLLPGGEMLIGNMRIAHPSRYFMEYWLDWKIILRSEEQLLQLAAELPDVKTQVLSDETGIQMFLHVKKRAADD